MKIRSMLIGIVVSGAFCGSQVSAQELASDPVNTVLNEVDYLLAGGGDDYVAEAGNVSVLGTLAEFPELYAENIDTINSNCFEGCCSHVWFDGGHGVKSTSKPVTREAQGAPGYHYNTVEMTTTLGGYSRLRLGDASEACGPPFRAQTISIRGKTFTNPNTGVWPNAEVNAVSSRSCNVTDQQTKKADDTSTPASKPPCGGRTEHKAKVSSSTPEKVFQYPTSCGSSRSIGTVSKPVAQVAEYCPPYNPPCQHC